MIRFSSGNEASAERHAFGKREIILKFKWEHEPSPEDEKDMDEQLRMIFQKPTSRQRRALHRESNGGH